MAAKKKKTTKKPEGKEKALREIGGIMLVCVGVLSLIALFSSAPLLTRLIEFYRTFFGIGVYVLPLVLMLLGLYVIVRTADRVMRLIMHVGLATLWFVALVHMLKFRSGFSGIADREELMAGGGYVAGAPADILNGLIGPAGGVLVLFAAALIYLKLTTAISYRAVLEKLAKLSEPVLARLGKAASAAGMVAGRRVVEMKNTMAENRRDRLEALKREREKTREERARKLMEEIQACAPTADAPAAPEKVAEKHHKPEIVPFQMVNLIDEVEEEIDLGFEDSAPEATAPETPAEEPETAQYSSEPAAVVNEKPEKRIPIEQELPLEAGMIGDDDDEEVLVTDSGPVKIAWRLPEPDDWLDPVEQSQISKVDNTLRDRLNATLKSFSVPAYISNVIQGASFTRFEVTLEPGVKVSKVVSLESDIALSLAADSKTIRIEAPIPGKSAIGIEVPNKERAIVPLRKIFMSQEFQTNAKGALTFVLGEDIAGVPVWANLVKMPHLLVAGSTNSGKSVCINGLISSIIARNYPEDVRFIMMDMKRVELTPYEGIPHLLTSVVTEADVAASALKWVCEEMDKRYRMFAEVGVRNIDGYNKLQEDTRDKLYRIVVIIDELADLMMVSSAHMNVEMYICRIAQLARATGIHIVLATQRPDTKVITGTIKNNIPTRISFSVPTQIDSRTILDQKGAEALLGRGDMLYMPVDTTRLARLQGAFVSDQEAKKLVDFWKAQGIVEPALKFKGPEANVHQESDFVSEDEELYSKSVEIVVTTGMASISSIQRKLRIGYNRAARLVELMEERGVVGPYDGVKPREVLLTRSGFEAREY